MKHEGMNIRRIIRANRLLSEQGHKGDSIGALNELTELRKAADRIEHLELVLVQAREALTNGSMDMVHETIAAIDEALKS